jgi:hypothetical protein
VVGVESDFLDVERLGSVDIGDRHSDKLEFHLHDWTLTVPTDTGDRTLRVRFDSWTGRRPALQGHVARHSWFTRPFSALAG